MKKTALLSLLCIAGIAFAQDGSSRIQAIPLTANTTCAFTNFSTGNAVIWHKFVATSNDVNINLKTEKFGNNSPHIHHVAIFEGNNTLEKTHDELPFHSPSDKLKIDLNASRLTIGETYYLRLDREAHIGKCDKVNCKAISATNVANYAVCIQEENVFIPLDFEDEEPLLQYALEQNKGQLLNSDGLDADEVLFFNNQVYPAVFITNEFVSLAFNKLEVTTNEMQMQRIDLEFVNSALDKRVFKGEETAELKNYYLPHNKMGNLDVKSYKRIVMQEIYPDIDMHYYSQRNGMKYYFKVGPKGNAADILLRFNGASDVIHNADGSLDLVSEFGRVTFERPLAYQINPAGELVPMPWQGEYDVQSNKEVRFKVKNYPHEMPLIIRVNQRGGSVDHVRGDNRMWATYYGGSDYDDIKQITNDEDGNIYFIGSTKGISFPSTGSITIGSSFDSRVVCGAHTGTGRRKWTTIFGAQNEIGNDIATDKFGNVFITGQSVVVTEPNQFIDYNYGDFNMAALSSTVQASYAFITKFSQNNGALKWSSLFGEHNDGAYYVGKTICTDAAGGIYMAGEAHRIANAPIVFSGTQYVNQENGVDKSFLVRFTPNNHAVIWSTLFGNDGTVIHDMTLDRNENLFITGETTGTNVQNFPLLQEHTDDFMEAFDNGTKDAFVAKFDKFNKLKWSTLFGGDYEDRAYGIAVSGTDDVAVVGSTMSPKFSFPLKDIGGNSHFEVELHSTMDAFITVFELPATSPTKYALKYSTYFGGDASIDKLQKVVYTYFGTLLAVGTTWSNDMYNTLKELPGAYNQYILEGDATIDGTRSNAFIFAADKDYNYIWSTLFGGKPNDNYNYPNNDEGLGITAFSNQYFHICGITNSQTFFPVLESDDDQAYFQDLNGTNTYTFSDLERYADGFLAQFSLSNSILSAEKIDWHNSKSVFLYPNPSQSNIKIVNYTNKMVDLIEIIDLSGKVVKRINKPFAFGSNSYDINISELTDGYYQLMVHTGLEIYPLKLIKE